MKLIRVFIAFVVVSLFVGIGSAFNGKDYSHEMIAENNKLVEKPEVKQIEKKESTEIVKSNDSKTVKEEKTNTNNSFSESNQEKSTSSSKKNVSKSQTANESKPQTKSNTTISSTNETPPVDIKPKELNTAKIEVKETPVTDNSANDDKINSTYYSITKGQAEYETQSGCESAGLRIQNKELDSILDWNEEHPDEQKKPVIGSSMCIIVMKNGKEHWFLHFLTTTKENLDEELKNLYK